MDTSYQGNNNNSNHWLSLWPGGNFLFLLTLTLTLFQTYATIDVIPPPCSAPPADLLDTAVPSVKELPSGVNVLYDRVSHVHAYQFGHDAKPIAFKAEELLLRCLYFPYEFSLFITLKQYVMPRREQCVVSLFQQDSKENLISVSLTKDRLIFRYRGKNFHFRMSHGYQNRRWHTFGISKSADTLSMTRDCKGKRRRPLRMPFPDLLPVVNTSFSIGRCQERKSVFQGLLKSVILVPGGDASARACPPKMDIQPDFNHVIRTFPGYSPLAPLHSRPSACRWTDVGNIAFDVHVNLLKVCVNGVWREVKIASDTRRLDYFVLYQTIDTGQGSLDVEVFDLPGEGKFAVFASVGDDDNTPSRSGLYRWENGKFVMYQTLPSQAAQAWEFFDIRNQFFLAVANYGASPLMSTNSTIFRWSKNRRKFRKYQQIQTYTARDVEAFKIDGDHYLAVANHAKDDKNEVDSVVYKWSRLERKFVEYQRILSVGAYDWTHFTVDDYHFLALANAFTGVTTLVFSVLFFWQNDTWVRFQTMETNGATDWEHFTINGDHYLVVANAYNYGSQNFRNVDNYRTNSTIFKLDVEKRSFLKYQTIVTYSAVDWEYMQIGPDHFLMVSNAQNGDGGGRMKSVVYRWQGMDKFVRSHALHTLPNADVEMFRDNTDIFLVYGNAKAGEAHVLKVKFV